MVVVCRWGVRPRDFRAGQERIAGRPSRMQELRIRGKAMDIQDIGAWGEFLGGIASTIGAFGVIVTLIYLANQIQQNTNLARSQITTGLVVAGNQQLLSVAAARDLREIAARATGMTGDDLAQTLLLASVFREIELQFTVLRPQGLLDPALEAPYNSAIRFWLTSDEAQRWWETFKGSYTTSFAGYIDALLAKAQD